MCGWQEEESPNDAVVEIPYLGDLGSIPGWGRCPGEGNGNPLQYSCLGYPMDRGTLWATVHGVSKESDTTEQLNTNRRRIQPQGIGGAS